MKDNLLDDFFGENTEEIEEEIDYSEMNINNVLLDFIQCTENNCLKMNRGSESINKIIILPVNLKLNNKLGMSRLVKKYNYKDKKDKLSNIVNQDFTLEQFIISRYLSLKTGD